MDRIRAFIAVPLCKAMVGAVGRLQADFLRNNPDFRPVKPENLHLTLHFFGDVRQNLAFSVMQEITGHLRGLSPFYIEFHGLGVFPGLRRPRVLWLGIDKGVQELKELAGLVNSAVRSNGLPVDPRPFRPHLTIARAGRKAGPLTRMADPGVVGRCPVDRLVLFKSTLTPRGPIYESLTELGLGG